MWMLVMIVLGTSVVIEPMILSDNMTCFSQNTREMVAITLMALSIMLCFSSQLWRRYLEPSSIPRHD